jgi:hypothetical protein
MLTRPASVSPASLENVRLDDRECSAA